ncbi:hypothetical protein MRB53_004159 [Persea americana]|uniref:Uncharacterized protein n=1 Tax=Persea americana TaxID=3435 RepID=A0ACC2MZM3_PERAE|nr:hypothetical protein MRB53_004159 [Persea americana]
MRTCCVFVSFLQSEEEEDLEETGKESHFFQSPDPHSPLNSFLRSRGKWLQMVEHRPEAVQQLLQACVEGGLVVVGPLQEQVSIPCFSSTRRMQPAGR